MCPLTDYAGYYHLPSGSGRFIPARIALLTLGHSHVTLSMILACDTQMVADDVLHHLAKCILLMQMVERDGLLFPGGLRYSRPVDPGLAAGCRQNDNVCDHCQRAPPAFGPAPL